MVNHTCRILQFRYGKGIECYVYYDFAGGWAQADAYNVENVMSLTGYVITYTGCSVLLSSELQTEIALSNTESEYISLIKVMHKVISFMALMKEVSFIFDTHIPNPEVF